MMKKRVFRAVSGAFLVGSLAVLVGCTGARNLNEGTGWNINEDGTGGLGGIEFEGSTLDMPTDGDRSLVAPVYFAYDSSQVSPAEGGKCEEVANLIRQGQYRGVILEGHADERGSREYNQSLGERRALSVREYLVGLGISPDNIQTVSYGEEQPADSGGTEAAFQKNRRVEFAIY